MIFVIFAKVCRVFAVIFYCPYQLITIDIKVQFKNPYLSVAISLADNMR